MSKIRNHSVFSNSRVMPVITTAMLSLLGILAIYSMLTQAVEAAPSPAVRSSATTLPAPSISYSNTVVVEDNRGDTGYMASTAIINGKPASAYYNESYGSLMYVQAADADGTTWLAPVTIASGLDWPGSIALAVVNGKPAIVYQQPSNNYTTSVAKYVRANDADGASWGTPITAVGDGTQQDGQGALLAVIDGKPAISYYAKISGIYSLRFVRANDAAGTSWGSPIVVDAVGRPYTGSFSVVNGKPAIAYYRSSGRDLIYVQAIDAAGSGWKTPVVVESTGMVGFPAQLVVADGRPAIAYQDITNRDTKYVRATDADGDSWGNPIVVDNNMTNNGIFSSYLTMNIIDGKPAIVSSKPDTLNYFRATDASGSSWSTPITLTIPQSSANQEMTLVVANGKPAIGFTKSRQDILSFIQAADTTGSSWNNTVDVTGGGTGFALSSVLVNGHPAISYVSKRTNAIHYIRATDAEGSGWGTPVAVKVFSDYSDGDNTQTALSVIDGHPAIAYYDQQRQLKFVRANDPNGTAWGAEVEVDNNANWSGSQISLTTINGRPAIAYVEGNNDNLTYIRATDSIGSGWGTPIMVDSGGDTENSGSLITVNGVPAIVFQDRRRLKYVQANDTDGSSWKPAVLIDNRYGSGSAAEMMFIAGKPVIGYTYITSNDKSINVVTASDPDGSTWLTPTVVLSNTFSSRLSMATIDDRLALSYYNDGLRYIHAEDATGTAWGSIETPNGQTASGQYGGFLDTFPIGPYGGGVAYFNVQLKRLQFTYFRFEKYELTLANGGNGTGSVAKTPDLAAYDPGTEVQLTATAGTGSLFSGWSGAGCGSGNTCTVTMDAAKTVTATFVLEEFELTVNTAGNGTGSVAQTPNGGRYEYGTVVTLTATADPHAVFSGWVGADCSGTDPVCVLTIDAAKTVTATFALEQHALTTATSGSGTGTISRSPDSAMYDHGTTVTLTATADEGSTFAGWKGGGCSGKAACMVTMDKAQTVTATFIDNEIGYQIFLPLVQR